jgi:dTDP-4-amino-4,6-dideoxy-D-glucose acyltransferase
MQTSFYSESELENLGFKSIGDKVLISRKASFYGEKNISLGNNIRIDDFCILSGKIDIGNFVHIGAGTYLFGGEEGITFKDFAGCSPHVSIFTSSENYSGNSLTNPTVPEEYRILNKGPVMIEKYVIIGTGSVVLPSLVIREGSAIGTLSLVDKNTDPWRIYFGAPIRPIKKREKKLLELEKEILSGNNLDWLRNK